MSAATVLLEVRRARSAEGAADIVDSLLPAGVTRDQEYVPVPMDGGRTWIVRCVIADALQIATLEAHPDVVDVWPDSRIAPM